MLAWDPEHTHAPSDTCDAAEQQWRRFLDDHVACPLFESSFAKVTCEECRLRRTAAQLVRLG